MNKDDKKTLADRHQKHWEENWSPLPWKAWGSWFSWGSPVGLGLFFIAVAITIWIIADAL